ncbi:MAG: hypothetical protein QOI36_5133 [Pseudonocardiales bacterium]|nr:hypothetical protein [Pseudonocardiales bacterium]
MGSLRGTRHLDGEVRKAERGELWRLVMGADARR